MDLSGDDLRQLGQASSDDTRFDASQYAFFGQDILEEVELGGLEEDDNENVGFVGVEEFGFSSTGEREEGEGTRSLSEIDDLAGTFSTLSTIGQEQRNTHTVNERDPFIRENWLEEADTSDWLEQQILEADRAQKIWESQQQSSAFVEDTKALQRTSTFPQQQQGTNLSEPILVPKSMLTSYPPPGGGPYASPRERLQPTISPDSANLQMPFSTSNMPSSQFHMAAQNRLHFNNNMNQFIPPGLPITSHQQNLPLNPNNLFPMDQPSLFPNALQHKLNRPNGFPHFSRLMNPQALSQQEQQRFLPLRPSPPHASVLHPQLLNAQYPPPPMMNKIDPMRRIIDMRDERSILAQRGRENIQFSQQYFDNSRQRNDFGWPKFIAKYMSPGEIENIMRVQHAATHGNDPYVDDYYHQACLAKRSGTRLRHPFCPASISDVPSRTRANSEPHPYLHVDALGRIAFSSVRRPRPLLEVDSTSTSDNEETKKKCLKPLEEEPMLAARITIEDGLCIILDVDDIDRILQFNQPLDGGSQLKQRRMVLIEGLVESLHLVDPFGPQKTGQSIGLAPRDDLVFLRIVSLPKGRKLLHRLLRLLSPGSNLTRIICMAIFRHLRFLFGGPLSDATLLETTSSLASALSSCVHGMDLTAISACLAAIVCSSEKPPLRPIGGSSGDGASVAVKSVLDRATTLLADPLAAQNLSMSNRALWQESFNAFFKLLTDYCFSKYDSIVQSMHGHLLNTAVASEVARAIGKEMPIELLRASLPHTDEQQRKLLLDFAQRSMPV